jgi:hypothetical protein
MTSLRSSALLQKIFYTTVAHTERAVVSDHPICAASEASRHFLNGAATPPHEEGIALASDFTAKPPDCPRVTILPVMNQRTTSAFSLWSLPVRPTIVGCPQV